MKFNINLDWAVITSIFTLFLFWCGYWYFAGFASFYDYQIDAFDLPLAPLIIMGLMIGYKYVIYLIFTLISLSFLLSVDRKLWNYLFSKGFRILLNIYLLFYYMYKHFSKSTSTDMHDRIGSKLFKWLKPRVRGTIRLDHLIGLKVQRYFKKHKLSDEDLKKSIYGDPPLAPSVAFEITIIAHYFLIIVLIYGLATLFQIGQDQNTKGFAAAEKQFKNFPKMIKVIVNKDPETDSRTTELCFKGHCLITDKDKNVQLHDMKDVKVLHTTSDKKAP